jgi:hypothetical protein
MVLITTKSFVRGDKKGAQVSTYRFWVPRRTRTRIRKAHALTWAFYLSSRVRFEISEVSKARLKANASNYFMKKSQINLLKLF